MTTPVKGIVWLNVNCISPVPGGISKSKKSSSPQTVSSINCFSALEAIGPLHTTAFPGSSKNPIDISLIPYCSIGTSIFLLFTLTKSGNLFIPSIKGIDGPYISASINPTLAPCFAKAAARFTATVDFPTPPLPDAIAPVFLTPFKTESLLMFWVVNFSPLIYSKLQILIIITNSIGSDPSIRS